MAANYIINAHSNPISSARIIDVMYPPTGQIDLNGTFIVRVPEGIAVVEPTSVVDLLSQKYQNLIALYVTTQYVAYDDMLDATGIDLGTSSNLITGERNSIGLFPGSILTSNMATLSGAGPAQAFVTWELFEITYSDPVNGRVTRTYNEVPSTPTYASVQVSFNNGATPFLSCSDGNVLNIPPADRGTQLLFRITNVHPTKRLYLASWAVVY
jgi:hypothetical protein